MCVCSLSAMMLVNAWAVALLKSSALCANTKAHPELLKAVDSRPNTRHTNWGKPSGLPKWILFSDGRQTGTVTPDLIFFIICIKHWARGGKGNKWEHLRNRKKCLILSSYWTKLDSLVKEIVPPKWLVCHQLLTSCCSKDVWLTFLCGRTLF